MQSLRVKGGAEIRGSVTVSGNKNAALPMIAALLLAEEECVLRNVPDILDVRTMLDNAGELGAEFSFKNHVLKFRCRDIRTTKVSREMCSRNRTSILFAAPLIARCGAAELFPPGGDVIGRRRLDGPFYGLIKLGSAMSGDETYRFHAPGGLFGRELFLDEASVTATEQILIAAVTAKGKTTLYNAAGEPHVQDLAQLLNAMGGRITGAGSNTIEIEGVEKLHGCDYTIAGDHIEAGSFLALAAATGGELTVHGTAPRHNWMLRRVFERLGDGALFGPDHPARRPAAENPMRFRRSHPADFGWPVAAVSVGHDELFDRRGHPVHRHGDVLREDVRKPDLLRGPADQHGSQRDRLRPAPGGDHRQGAAPRGHDVQPGHPRRNGDGDRGALREGDQHDPFGGSDLPRLRKPLRQAHRHRSGNRRTSPLIPPRTPLPAPLPERAFR